MKHSTLLNISRQEARKIMMNLHPNINWKIHYIHHKDHNPFNNNLNNLEIISKHKHHRLHANIQNLLKSYFNPFILDNIYHKTGLGQKRKS